MRLALNGPRAHLALCALFTWGVTACVSEVAPTQSGYDIVHSPRAVATGTGTALIRDTKGQVLFSGAVDARARLQQSLAARGRSITAQDTTVARAMAMALLGVGAGRNNTAPLTVSYGGRTITLAVQSRAADGRATGFTLSMGDTTLTLSPVAGRPTEHQMELTTGAVSVARSTATLDYTTMAAAAQQPEPYFPGEDLDEAVCLEYLVAGSAELIVALIGFIDGFAQMDLVQVMASVILVFTSVGNFWLFYLDCPRTFERWLWDSWAQTWFDICNGLIILSWTPACGEE